MARILRFPRLCLGWDDGFALVPFRLPLPTPFRCRQRPSHRLLSASLSLLSLLRDAEPLFDTISRTKLKGKTMSWQPQPDGLNEFLNVLRQSISGDNEVQRVVSTVGLTPSHLKSLSRMFEEELNVIQKLIRGHSAWESSVLFPTSWPTWHMSSSIPHQKAQKSDQ